MNFNKPCAAVLRVLFAATFIACLAVPGKAQLNRPFKNFTIDSLRQHAKPGIMPIRSTQASRPAGNTTCNTSTFYMHLTAGAGKKIALKDVQTTADGSFLLGGNVTLPNTEQEGLLCLMNNAGSVITQKQIRVSNQSTTLYNIRTLINGQVAIAGIVHDGTEKVFVALLNSDLSTNWLQTIDITGASGTALDIVPDNKIYIAAQVNNQVYYQLLDNNGGMIWSQQLTIYGLDNIAGIGHNLFQQTLTANCTIAGKKEVQLFDIDEKLGGIISSGKLGDGTEENKINKVTSFNSREIISGITKKTDGSFILNRRIYYDANYTETLHNYNFGLPADFGVSTAQDVAGGAMGFCFPVTGKLMFIKHFASYNMVPEHTASYTVPLGASIAGVTRSVKDGGYLFALNTIGAGESILVKTDSIGIISGCNYQNINTDYTERVIVPNSLTSTISNAVNPLMQPVNLNENSVLLTGVFDCKQNYCPPPPLEDTCLSSYFKLLKSNSYIDAFNTYHLMRNNKHIMVCARYNNELGDINMITYGIKLFDEKGNFIKGVNAYDKGLSAPIFSKQVDDQHIMVIYYSPVDTVPSFTFTLMDDNLQTVWSKSIKTFKDFFYFGSGTTSVFTSDKEGNFYFFGVTPGYFEKARAMVYKMDAAGNPLWQKFYELDVNGLLLANATTTAKSLILIAEGRSQGSVSLNISKETGELLNAYIYQNKVDGSIYTRFVKFDGDRVYYAGNDINSKLVTGIFDTTGKPIKLLSYGLNSSSVGAATTESGKLFVMYVYYDGTIFKDVLLKTDKDLQPEYANGSTNEIGTSSADMAVSQDGSIYIAGNYYPGEAHYDPFLKKIDPNGLLGTCASIQIIPETTEMDLQTKAIGFRELNLVAFTSINVPLVFVPDTYGQQIATILCSSTPNCNSIKLNGTTKVCQLNQTFTYHARRNVGCTIKSTWLYDTAMAVLQTIDDSTATLQFKKFGNTWLKVKLNAGCSFFVDSILVQVQQSPAVFNLGNDTIVCKGSSVTLNAGTGFSSYLWQDGSANATLTVTQPGVYFVTAGNVCGEFFKDTLTVQQVVIPALTIGNDTAVCKGDTLHLLAGNGFAQYNWQPAISITGQGPAVAVTALQNTIITLQAATAEGCKAFDTLSLSIKTPRQLSLGNDTSICTGDSISLSAGGVYQQYQWSNGAITPTVKVKQPGNYILLATDFNGCTTSDSLQLQLYPLPKPSLGNDIDLCRGSQRQLDAGNFNQYLWQDGSSNRFFTVAAVGVYSVTVTDNHFCVASDTIQVKNILALPAAFLQPVDSICQYEKVTLNATGNFSAYLWSDGSAQPQLTTDAAGLYKLTVKDGNGCSGTDSVLVIQKNCFAGVYIPTAFSPNGDLRNDVFRATVYGTLTAFRLEIFNRYGEMVFTTTDPLKGWNGVYKGIAQPSASFVWQCTYQFPGKFKRFMKGNVVLVR